MMKATKVSLGTTRPDQQTQIHRSTHLGDDQASKIRQGDDMELRC